MKYNFKLRYVLIKLSKYSAMISNLQYLSIPHYSEVLKGIEGLLSLLKAFDSLDKDSLWEILRLWNTSQYCQYYTVTVSKL